jgi:hypothetical protein
MRHLLSPITFVIWFLLTYYAVYFGMVLMIWMFSLDWIWLILGYSMLLGLISMLVNVLPILINNLILKFYKFSWFSVIAHSVAGLLAIIAFYYVIYQTPPEMVTGDRNISILKAFWEDSWLKTILLFIPFVTLQFMLIFQGVFNPIMIKLDNKEQDF